MQTIVYIDWYSLNYDYRQYTDITKISQKLENLQKIGDRIGDLQKIGDPVSKKLEILSPMIFGDVESISANILCSFLRVGFSLAIILQNRPK